MTISDDMRLALQRQLDAEDDLVRASDTLDTAHQEVMAQKEKEGLFNSDVEAMLEQMKRDETDKLERSID